MQQLSSTTDDVTLKEWRARENNEFGWSEILSWLKQSNVPNSPNDKERFLLEALRTALLADICDSLAHASGNADKNITKPLTWFKNLQLKLLIASGSFLAISGGYSSITSLLLTFAAPMFVVVGTGAFFSAVALACFYHFDRLGMIKIFGAKLGTPRQLLDVCVNQVEQIKKIRKIIELSYFNESDPNKLKMLHEIAQMIDERYVRLGYVRQECHIKLNNPYFKAVKFATVTMEGGLVMAGGFFAGKSVATAIASLFVTSVSTVFWPIVIAGVVLSLAALSVYCVVERPGYEKRVGRLLGVDKDKIDNFAGQTIVDKQIQKLNNLGIKIKKELESQEQIEQLHKQIEGFEQLGHRAETKLPLVEDPLQQENKPSSVILSGFFKRSVSLNDLGSDKRASLTI